MLIIELKAFWNNIVSYFTRQNLKNDGITGVNAEKVENEIKDSISEQQDTISKSKAFRFYNTFKQLKESSDHLFPEKSNLKGDQGNFFYCIL